MAYSMGFIGGLLDDDALKAAIVSSGAVFGGVSSGAGAAAYAMAALNGVGTMEHWYFTEMRKGFEIVQNRSTLAMGEGLETAAHRYYTGCLKVLHNRADEGNASSEDSIPWLRHLPMAATSAWPPTLRPRFVTEFATAEAFVQGMVASSYVPGVMGLVPHMGARPWVNLPDGRPGALTPSLAHSFPTRLAHSFPTHSFATRSLTPPPLTHAFTPAFDGYLGSWRVRWPDSYMYVSFLPTIPRCLLGKHVLQAFDYDSTGGGLLGLAVKSFPWGDAEWADDAYRRGVRDAEVNLPVLRAQITEFLRDI
jgi:hypothetical protein